MSLVIRTIAGQPKVSEVKNLGWLLRNWKNVISLAVRRGTNGRSDCSLVAETKDGTYVTSYASATMLWHFLNRPIFEGLKVDWFGFSLTLHSRPHAANRNGVTQVASIGARAHGLYFEASL